MLENQSDYDPEDPSMSFEGANVLLSGASMGLNYAFIHDGQINEFAAGFGFFFGVVTLAEAARQDAQHPFLDAVVGSAAIVFSVWNLAGGMGNPSQYAGETTYYDGYDSQYSATPAGQTAGWTFSF